MKKTEIIFREEFKSEEKDRRESFIRIYNAVEEVLSCKKNKQC